MKPLPLLVLALFMAGCGSKSSPTPVSPTPITPTPSAPTLQSIGLSAALASLTQAGNTAQVTATGTFSNGTTQNVTATCLDWFSDNTFVLTISGGGVMTARNTGASTITTSCQGVQGRGLVTLNLIPAQLWSVSGTGNQVFEMPSYVRRVRIVGTTNSRCQNFAVRIAGRLVVNVILGTCSVADVRNYDGTHQIAGGGTVETIISSGINWTLTEVR